MSFTDFFLEILNGSAVTPELLWLVMISLYLSKEAKRRGLHALDWFSLPPSMNFMLAIFISDLGIWLKTFTVWIWRRTGAGPFNEFELTLLVASSTLTLLGTLCKIRAMTAPDHGRKPWLIALAWTVVMTTAMLAFR